MKARPVSLKELPPPSVTIEVYQDPNGNWFASVEIVSGSGRTMFNTGTWTTPQEAIREAEERL
jgi:hypothetical protein